MDKVRDYFSHSAYILFHPADGFYSMKHENRGRTGIIFINLVLFWLSFTFQKQYAGFAMNENDPAGFNILRDFIMVIAAFLLWCTGNWSITTLMEGEGSFKDIAMAAAYSLTPVIIVFIPATIISNAMVYNEKEFYFLAVGVAVVWSLLLLFMGTLSVHDYTVSKTVVTVFLTLIAVLIILFLLGLMSSLIQQIFIFIRSLYTEIIYRI